MCMVCTRFGQLVRWSPGTRHRPLNTAGFAPDARTCPLPISASKSAALLTRLCAVACHGSGARARRVAPGDDGGSGGAPSGMRRRLRRRPRPPEAGRDSSGSGAVVHSAAPQLAPGCEDTLAAALQRELGLSPGQHLPGVRLERTAGARPWRANIRERDDGFEFPTIRRASEAEATLALLEACRGYYASPPADSKATPGGTGWTSTAS